MAEPASRRRVLASRRRYDDGSGAHRGRGAFGRRSARPVGRWSVRWSRRASAALEGPISAGRDAGARITAGGADPRVCHAAGTSSRPCSSTSTTPSHRAERNLQSGGRGHPVRRRGRRGAHRQRLRLRSLRNGLDQRPRPRPRGCPPRPHRHLHGQQLHDGVHSPVRRLQVLRSRPRARTRRAERVPGAEDDQPADGLCRTNFVLDYCHQDYNSAKGREGRRETVVACCLRSRLPSPVSVSFSWFLVVKQSHE